MPSHVSATSQAAGSEPEVEVKPAVDGNMQTESLEKDSSTGDAREIYIDPVIQKRVLRKLDMRLTPVFCGLYFLCYLDRANIGNAAVAGLVDQLGLTGPQFSTAVSVFFATYVGLIFPLVLAMKKLKPHRAITAMAFPWSVVTICSAFVRSYGSLIAVRLILGICEAGFFPCIGLYISMIWDRREQGIRYAYLFSAVSLSSMFGGLIATGITAIGTTRGMQAWSWLYIIEGIISIIFVPIAWFGLPETPAHAKFWTPEEREVIELRELRRRQYMGQEAFSWPQVFSALKDWRLYTSSLIQFLQLFVLNTFSGFLPSILMSGLGYSRLEAQYLSVPVYFLGGLSFFISAIFGDKFGYRGVVLLGQGIFAVAGYIVLATVSNSAVKYFACYLIAIPLFFGAGGNETWIVNNTAPHYRRATYLGVSQTVGNLAGVVAPQLYRSSPYIMGHWSSVGAVVLSMILIIVQLVYFRVQNNIKDKIARGERPNTHKDPNGEGSVDFKYVY